MSDSEGEKMSEFVYFAYGSNLNLEDMKKRCPSGTVIGKGLLKDYRLVYRGKENESYLNVEKEDGENVPIGIWEIDECDLDSLDCYEGYPELYHREYTDVETEKGTVTGMIYIMNEGYPVSEPADSYRETCMKGYADFGFDTDILKRSEK